MPFSLWTDARMEGISSRSRACLISGVGFGKLAPEIEQETDVQGKVAHDPIKPLPYGKTGEVLKFFPYGVPRLDAGPGFR